MNTKSYDYYAYSRVVVLSRGGRKILKQANPYIKPANERAFPRRANAVGVCIHQIHSFYGLETDSLKKYIRALEAVNISVCSKKP